jgi:hypothetical protein
MPNGRAPAAGEKFVAPAHAKALQRIAQTKGEAFYRGELAEKNGTPQSLEHECGRGEASGPSPFGLGQRSRSAAPWKTYPVFNQFRAFVIKRHLQ